MRSVGRRDRSIAEILRALPAIAPAARVNPEEVFARAEVHGVAGVLLDAWRSAELTLPEPLAAKVEARDLARRIDQDAHLATLERIDAELDRVGLDAIALKGPLFARRYYPRASARGSSDIDLLVAEARIQDARTALAAVGYVGEDSPEEERFRREHHHLHFHHPHAPVLELHFHAYRGFGVTLTSEALLARSEPVPGFSRLRVPAPEDELVYLAVHAASHRFGRIGWLYDLKLMVEVLTPEQIERAAARAAEWGYARVVALTATMLVDVLGVEPDVVRPLGSLDRTRDVLVRSIVVEPRTRIARAATRFAYTMMLADSPSMAIDHAAQTLLSKARQLARHHS